MISLMIGESHSLTVERGAKRYTALFFFARANGTVDNVPALERQMQLETRAILFC